MAAFTIAFILDAWTDGAISDRVRDLVTRTPLLVAPGRDDAVPHHLIAGVIQEARNITEGETV